MEHKHRKSHRNETSALRRFLLAVGLLALATSLSIMDFPDEATAQDQTVPYRINFQGRLSDNDGRIKPNGDYNIRFRLYDTAEGGSTLWEEERTSGDRIELRDGLFHVQLGSVQPLPPGVFATYPVYLEVELPSPDSATSSSPDWSEGPFEPRQRIASTPYAFNADQLDGMDSSEFVHLAPSETQEGSIDIDGDIDLGGGLQADGSLQGSSLSVSNAIQGGILDIGGSGSFGGTVSGSDGQESDEFTTLSQLEGVDVSSTAFLQGGNTFEERAMLGTEDEEGLSFLTDSEERMRVTPQGRVGIGTDSPEAVLDIRQYSHLFKGLRIVMDGSGPPANDRYLIEPTDSSGNELFVVEPYGNVGIGTDNPEAELDVEGDILASGELQIQGGGPSYIMGDLGVGTDDPQAALDVQGDTSISGQLSLGSASTAGELVFSDGTQFTGTITTAELSQDTTYVLPSVSQEIVEICTSAGNCIPTGTEAGEMWYWDCDDWAITPVGDQGDQLTMCDGEPTWTADGECPLEIGDEGPAGGPVFYVDDEDEHDFTYLEAAPEGWDGESDDPTPQWGCRGQSVPGASGTAIGDGADNTQAIVDFHDDSSNFNGEDYYTYSGDYSNIGCNDSNNGEVAAQVATEADIGGHSDWFLPSEDELQLMYDNLHQEGLGGFTSAFYWSSSEVSATDARRLAFYSGNWGNYIKSADAGRVRVVRAF